MEGCIKLGSCSLCFFMLLIFTIGLSMIAVASMMLVELYASFLDGVPVYSTSIIFIVSGIISILLSLIVLIKVGTGKCLSVLCNSDFCYVYLTSFIFVIMAFSTCELVGGINFYIAGNIFEILQANMWTSLKDYSPYVSNGISHSWNSVQHTSQCCGVENYTDWKNSAYFNSNNVPDSCCIVQKINCGKNLPVLPSQIKEVIYTRGCLNEISFESNYFISLSATLGLVFGILQLIGVCCALTLIRPIRRCYKTRDYQLISDSPESQERSSF